MTAISAVAASHCLTLMSKVVQQGTERLTPLRFG
jgi:hypothetical protein